MLACSRNYTDKSNHRQECFTFSGFHAKVMDVYQIRKEATSDRHCLHYKLDPRCKDIGVQMVAPNTLTQVSLFRDLDQKHLNLVAEQFSTESFSSGETVFMQGDRADRVYVVSAGKVVIRFKPYDGDILDVSEIEKDGIFGWSAVLGRKRYTSSAVCLEDTDAFWIDGDVLRKLAEDHPETGVIILERLAEVIAQRLQNTHEHVVQLISQGVKK
jgi:signal-transduction protein with cAMP-binding, CBS, and nucleotidyltransferase domain